MTMLHKLGCCLFTVILFTSCTGKSLDLAVSENRQLPESSEEKLHYLDLNNPSIVQPFDTTDKSSATFKFVEVEVVEVVNPGKLPLAFKVHYQTRTNERLYLGSFGLYPADNPGKFIVATQGKLKNEGAIVLSLVPPDKATASDTIRVGIKRIRLVNSR